MYFAMKAVIALTAIVGSHAGTIKDTVDRVCEITENLATTKQDIDAANMKNLFGEYASLVADKIDCSEDPYDPLLGFNLQGVPLAACLAAKQEQVAKNPQMQVQVGSAKCIEKIIDEDARTAAIWLDGSNTGALKGDKFSIRQATRYSFDENAKLTSYHTIYDSYWLLHPDGPVSLSAAGRFDLVQVTSAAMALFGSFALAAAFFVKRRAPKDYALLADAA